MARTTPQSLRAPIPREARQLQNFAANRERFAPEQTEAIEAARRKAALITLEDHIKRVVDAAPPLTAEQRDRLALLLRGGVA